VLGVQKFHTMAKPYKYDFFLWEDGRIRFQYGNIEHLFESNPVPWGTPQMDEIIKEAHEDPLWPCISSCQGRLVCDGLDFAEHTGPVLYALYYYIKTGVMSEDYYDDEYDTLVTLIELCNERLCEPVA